MFCPIPQYLQMLNFVANLGNPYFNNPEIFQKKITEF